MHISGCMPSSLTQFTPLNSHLALTVSERTILYGVKSTLDSVVTTYDATIKSSHEPVDMCCSKLRMLCQSTAFGTCRDIGLLNRYCSTIFTPPVRWKASQHSNSFEYASLSSRQCLKHARTFEVYVLCVYASSVCA